MVAGISVPWPAVWTTALSMTASCLSTLSEFESLLGHERLSDVAIRYLGALIFFVNLKNVMVTICRAGTFQLSTNL